MVVLVDDEDHEIRINYQDEGAQDVISKNQVNDVTLAQAIRYAVERHQLLDELSNAKQLLQRKNTRLAELYDTSQRFVDNMSHEFQTPLTVIREFTSLVRDGLDGQINDRQSRRLLSVVNRTDDLTVMVNDMLDIGRLDSGMLRVWRRRISVEGLLFQIRSILEGRADGKNVNLAITLDRELPAIYCDEEKVRRVIVNLGLNAIKFTREGGTVNVHASRYNNDYISIRVSDDGPGLNHDNLQQVFERFRQVKGTGDDQQKRGLGLGLNVAREFANLNLGEVTVDSQVSKGCSFTCTVPIADPQTLVRCFLNRRPYIFHGPASVSVLTVHAEPSEIVGSSPVLDEYLHHSFRSCDFVYQVSPAKWIVLTYCTKLDVPDLLDRSTHDAAKFRKHWTKGTLAHLSFQVKGTWHASDQSDAICAVFHNAVTVKEPPSHHRAKVLVVDDEYQTAAELSFRLEAAGYEVITAHDGRTGLDAACRQLPDAIVLDFRIEEIDGLPVLDALKLNDETVKIPIVILSGSMRDQQTALDRGASVFVRKPCDSQSIIDAVNTAMDESRNRLST